MSDFKTLSRIIHDRRSIFPNMYTTDEIPNSAIEAILANGNTAPTHKKTEPWRFYVIKGESLEKLSKFLGDFYQSHTDPENFSEIKYAKTKKKPLQSNCVIAICMQRDPNHSVPEWEEIAATACAVQNIWLSCTSLGIGCYWSSPKAIHSIGEILPLKDGEKCLGLFYMGFAKPGDYHTDRGSLKDKVTWI